MQSDKFDNFPFCFSIVLDVTLCRREIAVARECLHVADASPTYDILRAALATARM